MGEYKGNVGTIYTQKEPDGDGVRWEAWFEDFSIIGVGVTELDALLDAQRMTLEMNHLCKNAATKVESVGVAAAGTGGD